MSLCFFLTAGLGTRLHPFTENLPKPCLPFLNLPLVNYGFFLAQQSGFKNYLFNKHHLPDQLEAQIQSLRNFCHTLTTSDETHKILGSGGALWKAKKQLSEYDYFLIANGDEILVPQNKKIFSLLVEKFKIDQSIGTLLTCDHPDLLKGLKPVWVNTSGDVKAFGMNPIDSKFRPVHYTGYKVFSKKIFNYIAEGESNIFYDVVKTALEKGERVSTLHLDNSHWYETGNFQSFLGASYQMSQNHWTYLEAVHSFFNQKIGLKKINSSDSVIHFLNDLPSSSINFQGFNVLGKNVTAGENVTLINSIVCNGVQLKSHSISHNSFQF